MLAFAPPISAPDARHHRAAGTLPVIPATYPALWSYNMPSSVRLRTCPVDSRVGKAFFQTAPLLRTVFLLLHFALLFYSPPSLLLYGTATAVHATPATITLPVLTTLISAGAPFILLSFFLYGLILD
ncbi:hypothetical protein K438DRAFT_2000779 [Mycena galopus ATCC 62051]|nr:hypothetical protein K438DRAFT_2000779 [Mycena galopus ATCC 62051]